jgi:hypothetical protein
MNVSVARSALLTTLTFVLVPVYYSIGGAMALIAASFVGACLLAYVSRREGLWTLKDNVHYSLAALGVIAVWLLSREHLATLLQFFQ